MKKHTALKPFDLSYDGINSVHVVADDVIEVPDALAPGLEAEGYISAAITDVAPVVDTPPPAETPVEPDPVTPIASEPVSPAPRPGRRSRN